MVVAHTAVIGAEPHAALAVDEDRPDGVVAQRSGAGGVDILVETPRTGIKNRKSVEGADPETPLGVAAQHADIVRNKSRIPCRRIAFDHLQMGVQPVEAVAVGGDPVAAVGGHDAGHVEAGHLRKDADGIAVGRRVGVDAVGGADQKAVGRGADRMDADPLQVGADLKPAAPAVEQHDYR